MSGSLQPWLRQYMINGTAHVILRPFLVAAVMTMNCRVPCWVQAVVSLIPMARFRLGAFMDFSHNFFSDFGYPPPLLSLLFPYVPCFQSVEECNHVIMITTSC